MMYYYCRERLQYGMAIWLAKIMTWTRGVFLLSNNFHQHPPLKNEVLKYMSEVMITRRGGGSGGSGGGNKILRTEIITEDRLFNVPNSAINNTFEVRLIGGGGGSWTAYTNNDKAIAGGGSGWMNNDVFTNLIPGDSIQISIGAGGNATRASYFSNWTASDGGTTAFGTYLSANGGITANNIGGVLLRAGNGGSGGFGHNGGIYGGGGGGIKSFGLGGTYGGNGGNDTIEAESGTNTIENTSIVSYMRGEGTPGGRPYGNGEVDNTIKYLSGGGGYGGCGGSGYLFSNTSGNFCYGGGGGGYGGNGGGSATYFISYPMHNSNTVATILGGGGGYGGNGGSCFYDKIGGYFHFCRESSFNKNSGSMQSDYTIGYSIDVYNAGGGGGYYCPANGIGGGGFGIWNDTTMLVSYGSGGPLAFYINDNSRTAYTNREGQPGVCVIQWYEYED